MMGVGTVYRLENIDGMILYRTSSHQSTTVRPLCWITWRRCLSTPQFWSTKIPAMIRRTKNVRLRGFIFIFNNFFYRELKMDIFENLIFFLHITVEKKLGHFFNQFAKSGTFRLKIFELKFFLCWSFSGRSLVICAGGATTFVRMSSFISPQYLLNRAQTEESSKQNLLYQIDWSCNVEKWFETRILYEKYFTEHLEYL